MFRLIGHRGLAAAAPENTLPGIEVAARGGLKWVEVDSRASADGIAVLSHDASLLRRSGHDLVVAATPAARLMKTAVDLGFPQHPARVPSLAQALDLAGDLNLGMVIEIKPHRGAERAAVQAVANALSEAAPRCPLTISSFSPRILTAAAQLLPQIPRILTCEEIPPTWPQQAKTLQLQGFHCHHPHATPQITQQLMDAGFTLGAYTVNNPTQLQQLQSWGLTEVFTDSLTPPQKQPDHKESSESPQDDKKNP